MELRAAQGLRMVAMRSDGVIDQVASAIRGAKKSVTGEHFAITDPATIDAANAAATRGVRGTMLVDAEMVDIGRVKLPPSFDVTIHGNVDWKVHTKLTTIDGARSYVSTASLTERLRDKPRIDFLMESEAGAGVLEELTQAAASGDHARMVRAADAAADAGFLLNDPAHGVRHLRDGLKTLADMATGDAYVGTKVLNDHKVLERFVKAVKASDGELLVETHNGPSRWRQAKHAGKEAGVKVKRLGPDPQNLNLHGNVVVAQTAEGPRMIVMTAPFTHRGLGQKNAPRMGREIGVVVDDPAHIQLALDRLGQLEGSQAAKFAARLFD